MEGSFFCLLKGGGSYAVFGSVEEFEDLPAVKSGFTGEAACVFQKLLIVVPGHLLKSQQCQCGVTAVAESFPGVGKISAPAAEQTEMQHTDHPSCKLDHADCQKP